MGQAPSPDRRQSTWRTALSTADHTPAAGATGAARPPGARPRRRILPLFAAVGVGVIGLDTVTKVLAVELLTPGEPVTLLGGLAYFDLIRNGGAAWGMGAEYTWVVSLVAIAISTGIAVYAWRRVRSLPWAVGLGMVFGGALGNIVDRLFRAPEPFHGHVVDMVSLFEPGGRVYPVFNLADSSLVLGVCFLVLLELTGRRADGVRDTGSKKKPAAGAAGTEKAGEAPGTAGETGDAGASATADSDDRAARPGAARTDRREDAARD